MTHQITDAAKVIDSRHGQYAILRLCAKTDDWNELVAIGTNAAVENDIAPALVQVTPLGPVDGTATPAPKAIVDSIYLVTVTKAKKR